MKTRFSKYGFALLFVALIGASACNRADVTITAPGTDAAGSALKSSFAAEPLTVRPEFLPTTACPAPRHAFGARVSVQITGGDDVFLRGLRFGFTDRTGVITLPDVIAIPSLSTPVPMSLPASSPIPMPGIAALPGATTMPLAGSSTFYGLFIRAGTSRAIPFFLRFDCGVPEGQLTITADAGDRNGRFAMTQLKVQVGG
jgi:hypothetical protein